MVKKGDIFLVVLLLGFGLFFIYLYFYIEETQKAIHEKIVANSIRQIEYVLENIEKDMLENFENAGSADLAEYFGNANIRNVYASKIGQLVTPNIKYIYLLYKDKRGRFRFLLDGSKIDKAHFYQKFDVPDRVPYENLYRTKTAQVIWQSDMENLWMTYLYPVKHNDNILGVLSVDMTTNLQKTILQLIQPLKNFFVVLIIFIFLLMAVGIVQISRYFFTRKQLFQDPLTKLFNRNYLQESAPKINLEYYTIAMLDLDRFKMINDTYGHKAGDLVLQESAEIFEQSIRKNDIIIRYGGEEFLLFIYQRNFHDEISKEICERIRLRIEEHVFTYEHDDIAMSVSIGIHEHPNLEKNLFEAIRVADSMLYIAKQRGRNQVVVYNEKQQCVLSSNRKDIDEVKSALDDNRIICHFQPILDPHSGKIFKYEALVRIVAENGELIYPGSFLPSLKHTNMHYKLTKKILAICFERFSGNSLNVSINISFLDLMNSDVTNFIVGVLTQNSELASRITFEILESDEIEDISVFKEKIEIIHSVGAKVAIDDFGSGYSNFKAILDIEADFLKIDGTLIKDIDRNEKDFKVVKTIILFAKESNMKTIAEFVSSKAIYDKLMALDVDFMQGFYIAKPSDVLECPDCAKM